MMVGMNQGRSYKYYDLIMAAFVAVLLCSNLIGVGKVCQIWGVSFGAGNLFFPISYIFGDVLTEVYPPPPGPRRPSRTIRIADHMSVSTRAGLGFPTFRGLDWAIVPGPG